VGAGGYSQDCNESKYHHTVDIALNYPSGSQVLLNTIMPTYVYTLGIIIPLRYLPYCSLYFKFSGATSKLNIAIKIKTLKKLCKKTEPKESILD